MQVRDQAGRFVEGNPGNPNAKGRPSKKREERYYQIAMSAVPFSQWKKIIKRAAILAEKGDAQARKFLADYLLGPPIQKHEVTGEGGGPIEIDDARADIQRKLRQAIESGTETEVLGESV